nr:unnamed protein product [Callosobruchus analis]
MIRQITKFNADNEDLYSEMESGDDELSYSTPKIVARVGNQACNILIDSGSEITAISEICYKNIASTINVPLLPITNTTVAVAVGNKRYRVKQQALVPVEFPDAEQTIEMTCLIIPDLNSDILAGCDWLRQNKVDIDFGERTVMLQGGIKIPMVNETADLVDDMMVEYERLKGNFESMREAQLAEKWIRDRIILLERLATESECREEDRQVVIVAARERLLSKAQRRASRLRNLRNWSPFAKVTPFWFGGMTNHQQPTKSLKSSSCYLMALSGSLDRLAPIRTY